MMSLRLSYGLHVFCSVLLGLKLKPLQNIVDRLTGAQDEKWARVVMRHSYEQIFKELPIQELKALEISGKFFNKLNFRQYRSVNYPEYDVCVCPLPDEFDLIIAEQIFEHLLWPYRAGRNVYQMLKPGGHFLISTPFFVRVHNYPTDCSRWTEVGLKHLLAECGFPLEKIKTFSWGNRACIKANFTEWVRYRRRIHSLRNEPDFPYHVWAFAEKPSLSTGYLSVK
jgi:SAM-dependent methyltransferase